MRRALGAAVIAVCLLSTAMPAEAAPGDPKSLVSAQRRANAAAARLASAQSAMARLEREITKLQSKTEANRRRLSGLESQVRDVAVRQYVQGGTRVEWLSSGDLSEMARSQAMVRFVTLGSSDAIDEYRAARQDLTADTAVLGKSLAERKAAIGKLRQERAAAMREVNRLAAIQRALEAKRQAAARARGRGGRTTARASRTSGAIVVLGAGGGWVCPVQGPRSFSNDWGMPRSGGRRHQGNDILAPRGTPVVASVSGVVRHHNSARGGLSYYLSGSDGNTYFGTHLSGYAASGRVAAGTVVGYVGTSGNASGGPPHLHFEIHPGGGAPVNPYPTVRAHC